MKRTISTRVLSLFLVIALLVSCCPAVFAEAAVEESQQTEAVEETEATEAPEETEATEATEETEPTEETEATEATEAAEAMEELEETELVSTFQGLPEGYSLSEEALEQKLQLADDETVAKLDELTPGEDYNADELVVPAETEEEARLYAQAYGAELIDYAYGMALIRLQDAAVPQAVKLAQDMEVQLPAAWPNYVVRLDPREWTTYPAESANISAMAMDAPQREDWNAWVNEILENPDPAIQLPVTEGDTPSWNYLHQYMHGVIDSYGAWGASTGKGVTVAVVDSGIKQGHPEFEGRVTYYDVGKGEDDTMGHGTHVAGIIGATLGNGLGGAGVAPDVRFISIRIFDGVSTTDYDIAKGINKAVDAGADVINLSLGGISTHISILNAVERALSKNVVLVAAMGNDGMNRINYPAGYPGVISVVASGPDNTRAFYSNYGDWADIAAPGTNIYSTVNDGDGYGLMSGTSMACPVVTGVVALYKSVHPDATPSQIAARLKATATKGGSDLGVGIVNAANMLSEKPSKPILEVTASEGSWNTGDGTLGKSVPCDSKLYIKAIENENDTFLLYTINDKNPGVKDGVVVTGERYDADTGIDLSAYAGQTVTVKAMQVSGLGVSGAVVTKQLTVEQSTRVTGVTISGPSQIVAGKKGEFHAVVEPADKADQSVTWELVSGGATGVKLDAKTGVLTTSKTSEGKVVIKATSQADPDQAAQFTLEVKPVKPVATLTLNESKLTSYVGDTKQLEVTSAIDTGKQPMNLEDLSFQWTSSNTKVAVVNNDGTVTAVDKGTATVTCKVLDGSGKTVKCTVTVQKLVEEIQISGQSSIAPGASASYKATILPADANTKKVQWSLVDAPEGVSIDANGKVKVHASVKEGQFYVKAVATDLGEACGQIQVVIAPKCTAVTLDTQEVPGWAPGAVHNKKGVLTGVNLFSMDLPNTPSGVENRIQLTASSGQAKIKWTSSKPSVAAVDENDVVTALRAGTATVTAAAQDGSGKKAAVTIKVTVPVSTMALASSAMKATEGMNMLTVGKSYKHTVTFGNLYGKPTNQKVVWTWSATTKQDGKKEDISSEVKGLISCNGGTLSAKAGLKKYLESYGNMQVTVSATSTDGTNVTAEQSYDLTTGTTVLKWYGDVEYDEDGTAYRCFYSDQFFVSDGSSTYSQFQVTSSNSKAVMPGDVAFSGETYQGMNVYRVYLFHNLGVSGKAKLTVTTTDGTKKSISMNHTFQ